jgi:hypothetical protein
MERILCCERKDEGSIPSGGTIIVSSSMDDIDCWNVVDPKYLWVTDKLLLAKMLGYNCGPAGLIPEQDGVYIVRPCVNYRMMSRGAQFMLLGPSYDDTVPDGFFWCEKFEGRHLSFDFHFGKQILAVEGFREDRDRLDRFSKWIKVDDQFDVPVVLQSIMHDNEWVNFEVIGDRVIEVHFRYNDDFAGHDSEEIIPVWKDQFYPSACGDRLGFVLK